MNPQRLKSRAFVLAALLCLAISLPAQDTELTNYKSGISATFSGTKGVAYAEEYFYSDKLVSDRKVVYIKSSTDITLSHNDRNVARRTTSYYEVIGANGIDGAPNTGDEGVIRYKVDGDLNWGKEWTAGQGGTPNPAYTAPLTFATLTYPSGAGGGLSVLGRTGNNGAAITSKSGYFTYGILDSFGDEWHTLTVADDDWNVTNTDTEWRASDGRVFLFVVDPKTPCFTARATGAGQFYTTPPKTYFIPKIHTQTTYIAPGTGTVTIELRDINGNNVFYRINGGSFIDAGAATVTLADTAFANGTNTLEYYYAGNAAFTKTRTVVKNPAFPSAGETHGFVLAGNPTNYAAMLARRTLVPYAFHWNREQTNGNTTGQNQWDINRSKGLRYVPQQAVINALVAKVNGNAFSITGKPRSHAAYAKEMLLQNARTIDNVGFEMDHPQKTLPTREITYRGYYDATTTLDMAYAYDLLISCYRSDQDPSGITPIEDYFIRDSIANNVVECLMFSNSLQSSFTQVDFGGMWDTARKCGAVIGMFAMPNYSTSYYGTSGLDGNTTVYPWTPFKDTPLTWKQVFLDDNYPMTGYPNLANRLGIDGYNCTASGDFADRIGYVDLTFPIFAHVANALKFHYPSKTLPAFEANCVKAVSGTIKGLQDNSGPQRFTFLQVYSANFPAVADIGVPYCQSLASSAPLADDSAINGTMPYTMSWYDVNYISGAPPPVVAPFGAQVTITVSP